MSIKNLQNALNGMVSGYDATLVLLEGTIVTAISRASEGVSLQFFLLFSVRSSSYLCVRNTRQ